MSEPEHESGEERPVGEEPERSEADPDAPPERVPDDWLDPKPFDPAGR